MRFWLGSCCWNFKKDLLWNIRLCATLDIREKKLWYFCRYLVYRSFDLWITNWKGSFWGGAAHNSNVKDLERILLIIQVDKNKINYPVDIPQEAKEFIEALVQKDPALRPKSQDLLKFKLFNLYPSKYKGRAFAWKLICNCLSPFKELYLWFYRLL